MQRRLHHASYFIILEHFRDDFDIDLSVCYTLDKLQHHENTKIVANYLEEFIYLQ